MKAKENLIPLSNVFVVTLRETLDEIETTQKEVALATGIPEQHLSEMKLGKRRCNAEYDLRLARYFKTSPGYFMRLQLDFDMRKAEREKGEIIAQEVMPAA